MTLLRTVDRGLIMSIEPIWYLLVASKYYKKDQIDIQPRMGLPLFGYPLMVKEWLWSAVTTIRVSLTSTISSAT